MAAFSSATRELVLKLVYYGPGLGGKTTTLKALHGAVRAEQRGKMVSLATPVDRTLYFDFLPVRLADVGDMQLRLQLFTVPGQVYFNATRKLVLTGADGIVFVADSQPLRLDANVESLGNLRENLAELGRPLESLPVVMAYNKRDLPEVLEPSEMDRELNPHGFASVPTSAARCEGVFETIDVLVRRVLDDLIQRSAIPPDVRVPVGGIIAARLQQAVGDERSPLEDTMRVSSLPVARSSQPPPAIAPRRTPVEGVEQPWRPMKGNLAPPPVPSGLGPAQSAPTAHAMTGVALTEWLLTEDHAAARVLREAMDEGLWSRSVVLLDGLLARVLEQTAKLMGRPDAANESMAWTLGLDPARYGRLRVAAVRARQGADPGRRETLEHWLTVATAASEAARLAGR